MLSKILPQKINDIIEKRLNYEKLYELRLRAQKPVTANYNGKFYYLSDNGLTEQHDDAIVVQQQTLNDIVLKASDFSLYSVNKNICKGFITIRGGIRIGITGEHVFEDEKLKTVKNFSGLTVRIPHEVYGCSSGLMKYIYDGRIKNTLILSPPACGKTTMLRDLTRNLSTNYPIINILLVDERSEIAASVNGIPQLDVGVNVDVISNSTKLGAFEQGIRSMNPDVIITDELALSSDVDAAYNAACSGVSILASCHALDQYDLLNKTSFDSIIKKKLFQRFIVLTDKPKVGAVSGVFDENFNRIYG